MLSTNPSDSKYRRPVALVPAYRPESSIITICMELLESACFSGVVCVNDGSGEVYDSIFNELRTLGVKTLLHHVNMGKGMALRTGLNYIACHFPSSTGVVTLDADGQHLAIDVIAVAETLEKHPHNLIMGCREFGKDVPFRSKFGNIITKYVMHFFGGIDVSDTQTGLRGIPITYIPTLLKLSTNGYDFETDMLVQCKEVNINIIEVKISTVYIEDNRSSSFRPLLDSAKIYYVLLRHFWNSTATAVIDFLIFSILLISGVSLFYAIFGGRCVAGLFNFYVGRAFVFRNKKRILAPALEYIALVLSLLLFSYSAIVFILANTSLSPFVAKLAVETTLFILSFAVQRLFIFKNEDSEIVGTNWDEYYRSRQSVTSVTRKITERLMLNILTREISSPPKIIMEFGGGDSCFYSALRERFPDASYIVVDKSNEGVHKFLQKHESPKCTAIKIDLLSDISLPKADIVFSVGLIEHFDPKSTAKIIKAHFDAITPTGLVLMTYPTPRVAYVLIRKIAELFHIWKFPDERPLLFDEVQSVVSLYGIMLKRKLNWFIGLTQEIVVAKGKL